MWAKKRGFIPIDGGSQAAGCNAVPFVFGAAAGATTAGSVPSTTHTGDFLDGLTLNCCGPGVSPQPSVGLGSSGSSGLNGHFTGGTNNDVHGVRTQRILDGTDCPAKRHCVICQSKMHAVAM